LSPVTRENEKHFFPAQITISFNIFRLTYHFEETEEELIFHIAVALNQQHGVARAASFRHCNFWILASFFSQFNFNSSLFHNNCLFVSLKHSPKVFSKMREMIFESEEDFECLNVYVRMTNNFPFCSGGRLYSCAENTGVA
jgi:hypothetical protein